MSLARQAGVGVAWTGAGKSVVQLVGAVVTLVLARVLTPADFGLVAMVAVITGFLAVFGEMGFAAALVQRAVVEERHRSSVFWLNLLLGLTLAGLLWLAAPFVARFYGEPRLVWLVRVLALDFLLSPFAMVQHAMLSRDLEFRTLAAAETVGALCASALAVGMALWGMGAWALVGRALAATAAEALVLWALSPWRPHWLFDRGALRDLFGFSANLFGYSTLNYWSSQIDDLLIGRFFGPASLGLYGRAYSTMMMPVTEVGSVLARVMFPTFSRLQHDPAETKQIYLRLLSVIAFITFPVMFGLAVLSRPFILVLFGPKWSGAATVLSIYCIVGASHAIGSTVAWIYKSAGRTDRMLRWGLVASAVTIAGIVIGVRLGSIESVAACYALATVVVLGYPRFAVAGKLIGLTAFEVFRVVRGALGVALLMAAAVWGLGLVVSARVPAAVDLGLRVLVGVFLYLVAARAFEVRGLSELRGAVRRMLLGATESAP
jgi:PST family polysaccharide transporter